MKKLLAILAGICGALAMPALAADQSAPVPPPTLADAGAATPAAALPPSGPPEAQASAPEPAASSPTATGENVEVNSAATPYTGAEFPAPSASVLAPIPESLWERVRRGFGLPEIDSPLVARHEAWFLNHPEYFQRMIERSRLYLYFIVEEIDKRHMPMEIALLPMIESAYNPVAFSRARAVGIWQFMPSTGKRYGLQQNWWYDGRRDVMAATRAALDYLEQLHTEFNDWQLALAAYNWGENGVSRAIVQNRAKRKPAEYRYLKMPRETRNYLPKLQAIRNIITNPAHLSFPLEDIPNRPYFTTVTTPEHIDMQVAARLAEMSVDDFRSLNPAHTRPVIVSNGSRTLVLPIDKADVFAANLKGYDQPLVSWQTYTLKKHEKPDAVANKFGITLARLREINGINRHIPIREGRSLLVPMSDDDDASNLDETWKSPEFQAPEDLYGNRLVYRVRTGDSLYLIALKHRVTVAALKEWNHLSGNSLRLGQRLTIYSNPRIRRH